MTIIADKDRSTIQNLLAHELVEDVELLLFTRGRSDRVVPGTGRQESQSCEETRELLEELVGLSDRLHLTIHDVDADPAAATLYNVAALPTVIIRRRRSATDTSEPDPPGMISDTGDVGSQGPATTTPARATPAEIGANVRFLGLPGGYEFSTLLADIVDISKVRTDLSAEALAVVRAIDSPVHIQVFVTPT